MEMSEALIQLADKLGIATTEIYQIILSAQQIKGVVTLVECFIAIGIMFLISKPIRTLFNKIKENESEYSDGSEKWMIVTTVSFISLFIMWITLGILTDALYKILMPEYTALTEMISTLAAFRW